MNEDVNAPRLLGIAFLIQATASLISGLLLAPVEMLELPSSTTISDAMITIANDASRIRTSIARIGLNCSWACGS